MDETTFRGPQGVEPDVWVGSTSGEWVCLGAELAESSLVRGGKPILLRRVYALELVRGNESYDAFGCAQCGQAFALLGRARYHLRECHLSPEKAPKGNRVSTRTRYFSEDFGTLTTGDLRSMHKAYLALLAENSNLRKAISESNRGARELIRGVDALRDKLQGK